MSSWHSSLVCRLPFSSREAACPDRFGSLDTLRGLDWKFYRPTKVENQHQIKVGMA